MQILILLQHKKQVALIKLSKVANIIYIMLVLLIIIMVTAPLLTVGGPVDLPESAADSLPDDQEPLTITINSNLAATL